MLTIEKGIFEIQKKYLIIQPQISATGCYETQSGRLQFCAVKTSLEILTACAITAVRQLTSVSVQKQSWETATDSVFAAIILSDWFSVTLQQLGDWKLCHCSHSFETEVCRYNHSVRGCCYVKLQPQVGETRILVANNLITGVFHPVVTHFSLTS